MKDMILSLYTHLFHHAEHFYLYNSESRALAEISEKLYSLLHDHNFSDIEAGTLQELKKRNIVIPEDEKYLYYYRQRIAYLSQSYNNERVSLTIAPYTGCNFECPYCYEEKKRPLRMTPDVEDSIVDFLKGHPSGKHLDLTWYGGEPLMAFQNIKSLYTKICEKTNYNIQGHGIITNGYLINQEVIDFFKETNLNSIQITLDGIKEHHNATRYLKKTKQGTFDQIIENIGAIVENLPKCRVSIRVNVNKKTADDYVELCKLLYERFTTPYLSAYPGIIREETNDKTSICYRCLLNDDLIPYYKKIQEKGGAVRLFPVAKAKGCMINTLNSYVVGPEGELYKCWDHVGDQSKIIGFTTKRQGTNQAFLGRCMNELSAFDDAACKDCPVFPICSGGCSWHRYKNKFEGGHFNLCSPYKDRHLLETALLDSLKEDKINKERTIFL